MNIIKRDGTLVEYNGDKIWRAVYSANQDVPEADRMLESQIQAIEDRVYAKLEHLGHIANVEEIQDLVIHEIMRQQAYAVAQVYTEYRYKQQLKRQKNTTDDSIMALIALQNEDINEENSNKNPVIESTQRDYIAGETSKDLTWRVLLPDEVVTAHKEGMIHFHDADYFLQTIYNCSLVNLKDMLTNGTVISEKMIESPKSFATACNVATQIVSQVASNQYGLRSAVL